MNPRALGAGLFVAILAGCSTTTLVATPRPTDPAPASPSMPSDPSASPSPDPVTATYPDGLPMTVGGEHAWRPSDILSAVPLPSGEILVAAWDVGGLAHSCPAEFPENSNVPCPNFEGLAEVRGGPSVIPLAWLDVPIQEAAALVVRVRVQAASTCFSNPPGGCPGPSLDVVAVVWAGNAALPSQSSATTTAFIGQGFGMEYPVEWQVISRFHPYGINGPIVMGAFGIGSFDAGCTETPNSTSCGSPTWSVPDDGVVLVYRFEAGLGFGDRPDPVPGPGETLVLVGGRAAVRSRSELAERWTLLTDYEFIEARWGVDADPTVEAQIDAVIASWVWNR